VRDAAATLSAPAGDTVRLYLQTPAPAPSQPTENIRDRSERKQNLLRHMLYSCMFLCLRRPCLSCRASHACSTCGTLCACMSSSTPEAGRAVAAVWTPWSCLVCTRVVVPEALLLISCCSSFPSVNHSRDPSGPVLVRVLSCLAKLHSVQTRCFVLQRARPFVSCRCLLRCVCFLSGVGLCGSSSCRCCGLPRASQGLG
jgi:hypothetical protein